jgi:HSP20 family protein
MTTLTRWQPWYEMNTLQRAFERLLDESLAPRMLTPLYPDTFELAIDVAEDDNTYIVKATVPGVKPEDVEITMQDHVLTIKGETKADKEVKEGRYYLRERRFGSFVRSLTMPAPVKAEAINATYENGVLTVRLPKMEQAKPKKIAVQAIPAAAPKNGLPV